MAMMMLLIMRSSGCMHADTHHPNASPDPDPDSGGGARRQRREC
jgi:hypothetical protein